jgi:hypothetical protein
LYKNSSWNRIGLGLPIPKGQLPPPSQAGKFDLSLAKLLNKNRIKYQSIKLQVDFALH